MHLNDNPEENLRMENEFLQLKLKAELGAKTFISSNFPPEIENEFLKNVLAFENSFSNAPLKKMYELLEKPKYEPETECAVEAYGSELIAYAREVLSRWGSNV